DGRGRLPVGGRPEEGHDQDRRRERGQPRGRGGDLPASGGGGGGRVRGAGREVDRGGEGGGGPARGREPHRRGTGGFPAGAAGAVLDAQARPVRRVSAEERQRQGAQAGAARGVLTAAPGRAGVCRRDIWCTATPASS